MSRRSAAATRAAEAASGPRLLTEASRVDVLLVLVLAAAVVVLCLGLLVLLADPEQPGLLDLRGRKERPVYPDRPVSPELRERLEEAEVEEAKTPTKATAIRQAKTTRTIRAKENRKDD